MPADARYQEAAQLADKLVGGVTKHEQVEENFEKIYGFKFSEFSSKNQGEGGIRYFDAAEISGISASALSRATTMNAFAYAYLMNKGYSLSQIQAGGARMDEEFKDAGLTVVTMLMEPESAGRMLAETSRAFNQFDLSKELEAISGKSCKTPDEYKAIMSDPVNKAKALGVMQCLFTSSREVAQVMTYFTDKEPVATTFSGWEKGSVSHPTFQAYMKHSTKEEQEKRTFQKDIIDMLGTKKYVQKSTELMSAVATDFSTSNPRSNEAVKDFAAVTAGDAVLDDVMSRLASEAMQGRTMADAKMPSRFYYGQVYDAAVKKVSEAGITRDTVSQTADSSYKDRLLPTKEEAAALQAETATHMVDREKAFYTMTRSQKMAYAERKAPDVATGSKQHADMLAKATRPLALGNPDTLSSRANAEGAVFDKTVAKRQAEQDKRTSPERKEYLEKLAVDAKVRKHIFEMAKNEAKINAGTQPAKNRGDISLDPTVKMSRAVQLGLTERALRKDTTVEQLDGVRKTTFDRSDDTRDFQVFIPYVPGMSDGERRTLASGVLSDYYSGDKAKREKALDLMYDRFDAFDFRNLDLSGLSKDGDQISETATQTDKDILKLIDTVLYSQSLSTKAKENPGYLEQRYSKPEDRFLFELKSDTIARGFATPISTVFLKANGYDQTYEKFADTEDAKRNLNMTAQYSPLKHVMSLYTGVYNAQMDTFNGKKGYSPVVFDMLPKSDTMEYGSTVGYIYESDLQKGYMKELGVDEFDLVMVDGVSVRETCKKQNLPTDPKAMKQFVMDSMMSGEHRVEASMIGMNKHGAYQVSIVGMQPDMHAFDLEQKEAHSKARRFFDFGATKIETVADKADKLWANDPDMDKRHEAIRGIVGEKIMAQVHKKMNEKSREEFLASKEHITMAQLAKDAAEAKEGERKRSKSLSAVEKAPEAKDKSTKRERSVSLSALEKEEKGQVPERPKRPEKKEEAAKEAAKQVQSGGMTM